MSALWEPITLGEHFLRRAEQYGDRIALSDGTQKVTYRQLVELAETDRERLRQAGVQPHELVIMQMSNGIPFVQMFLALMLEEVVPILMLPNHGVRELTGIQSKVHCRFHLTDDGIQHFDGMKQVAYVAPEAVVKAQSPDARIAILLLSGGTTGIPKLIPRTHGDYYYSCMQTANKNHWSDQTTLLTPLPWGITSPWLTQASWVSCSMAAKRSFPVTPPPWICSTSSVRSRSTPSSWFQRCSTCSWRRGSCCRKRT